MDMTHNINSSDLQILPIEQAQTTPAAWACEADFHTLDLNAVLRQTWQYAGHISQLKKVGDFFALSIAERSIIVVKSSENSIRAFYNVCKHRGGPLTSETEGSENRFKCQYHGWTYNLDGELKGTPEFSGVENFEKCDYSLSELKLDMWQGLIFVHMGSPQIALGDLLAGITERIAPITLDKLELASQTVDAINCNWKVYCENYQEGYHLPHVHPGLSKLLDYKSYRTELFEHYSLQYSPFKENSESIYAADNGEAYYYFIFPNIMLNILPGRLQVNRINAVAAGKCDVHFDYFYSDPHSAEGKKFLKEDLDYSVEIQKEDINICEAVQRNLASGVYSNGRFSPKRETGVHHFQSLLKRAYKTYLEQEGNGKIN
jgi:choline monooxygenase